MENLHVIKITNPLDKREREVTFLPYERISLFDLRASQCPSDINFVVSLNGQTVPEEFLKACYPREGDCVVFVPLIEGGGGDILRTLAMIAVIYVAYTYAPYLGMYAAEGAIPAGGSISGASYIAIESIVSAVATVGIMVVGGMLVNSLLPVSMPDLSGIGIGEARISQVYSWNPSVTQKQGSCIPRIYGTHKAYGNIVSVYTETISDQSYLNLLISLGKGPISKISDIYINDQPKNNFSGVNVETRYGYINQAMTTNFNDTKQEYPINRLVKKETPIIYTTEGSSFDKIEVDIKFPRGCYYMNNDGSLGEHLIRFKVELQNIDEPTLPAIVLATSPATAEQIATAEVAIATAYWSLGVWVNEETGSQTLFPSPFTLVYWQEAQAGSTVYSDHQEGQTQYNGIWRWLNAAGDAPGDTTIVVVTLPPNNFGAYSGPSSNAVTLTYSAEIPKKGSYNVTVTKITADIDDTRTADTVTLSAIREVYYDDFIYPREILVAIKALASNQLSGSISFSCIVEGSLIRVYDGANWTVEYNNNPAWVCYDVLSQPILNDPSYVSKSDANGNTTWYRCILSHTAAADKDPGQGASWGTYWVQADGTILFETWAISTVFTTYDHVRISTDVYRCKLGHTASANDQPGVGVNWTTYWTKTSWIPGASYVDITDSGIARYDGINPTDLDEDAFKLWADFCDVLVNDGDGGTEKRFEFDGIFDSEMSLWDASLRIALMSRASIFWNGSKLSVALDKAASPVQLFSAANIAIDSFEEVFLPMEERAGEVEISFNNVDKDYEKDTFTIFNTDINKPSNRVSLQLMGITKPSQAWRSGQFLLLCNQYLKRTINFTADVDAIACTLGDIISFQHDVPQWGLVGGVIKSAGATHVQLDQTISMDYDKTYAITIRLYDAADPNKDTLITKTVDPSFSEVTMTAATSGGGIMVGDDDNIDFGTGDFTLVWRGSLPDWTPSVVQWLMFKLAGGNYYVLGVRQTTNKIEVQLNGTVYSSSAALSLTDGTVHQLAATIIVGTTNTTVDFYVDGAAFGTQQTAANPGTVSNAGSLYILGTSTVRSAGTCSFAATFNRALSAAEVLSLYEDGIADGDQWGSQTANYSTDFSASTGWVLVGATISGGVMTFSADNHYGYRPVTPILIGQSHRLTYEVISNDLVGGAILSVRGDNLNKITLSDIPMDMSVGVHTMEITKNLVGTCANLMFRLAGTVTSGSIVIDNLILYKLGATLALEPEGIHTDHWYDSSTNDLDASYPAEGYSLEIEDTDILNFSTPFTTVPSEDDVYAFGESTIVTKPFRVQSLERSGDSQIALGCVEYDANIYSVDTGTPLLPVINYSALTYVSPVTNLSAVERVYLDDSGNVLHSVVVSFTIPNGFYKRANIYTKKTSSTPSSTILVGNTTNNSFTIPNLEAGEDYEILVQTEDYGGRVLERSKWSSVEITISDRIEISIAKVTGLQIFDQGNDTSFTGRDCKIQWNPFSMFDTESYPAGEEPIGAGEHLPPTWFKDYELKIFSSDGTLRRTEYVTDCFYIYTYEKNREDGDGTASYDFYFEVRSRDRFFNVSTDPAVLSVTNSVPSDVTGLTAVPIVGGVQFKWDQCTDADFASYYYRIKIGDGSWEDWKDVENNFVNRLLAASEIDVYSNKVLIYIEVVAKDLGGQVSSTTASASVIADSVSDNLFQLVVTLDTGITGTTADLYNGAIDSGGVIIT